MKSISKSVLGFTLVELLVVISIISILSVIGITIFTGAQKTARDARRRVDIEEIAKAMEINYGKITANSYSGLCRVSSGTDCTKWFNGGQIPMDPLNKAYIWCENISGDLTTDNPPVCKQGQDLEPGEPDRNNWMICAVLESGTKFCKTNMY